MYIDNFIYLLTWESGAALVTNSYSRCLPALKRFYRETKMNIPVGLRSSPIKIFRQIGPGVPEL